MVTRGWSAEVPGGLLRSYEVIWDQNRSKFFKLGVISNPRITVKKREGKVKRKGARRGKGGY